MFYNLIFHIPSGVDTAAAVVNNIGFVFLVAMDIKRVAVVSIFVVGIAFVANVFSIVFVATGFVTIGSDGGVPITTLS